MSSSPSMPDLSIISPGDFSVIAILVGWQRYRERYHDWLEEEPPRARLQTGALRHRSGSKGRGLGESTALSAGSCLREKRPVCRRASYRGKRSAPVTRPF